MWIDISASAAFVGILSNTPWRGGKKEGKRREIHQGHA